MVRLGTHLHTRRGVIKGPSAHETTIKAIGLKLLSDHRYLIPARLSLDCPDTPLSVSTSDIMTTTKPPFWTKALYEYKSDYEDDLSFPAGQVIQVTAIEDDEWYSGTYTDLSGNPQSGMFPKNFVSGPVDEPGSSDAPVKGTVEPEGSKEPELEAAQLKDTSAASVIPSSSQAVDSEDGAKHAPEPETETGKIEDATEKKASPIVQPESPSLQKKSTFGSGSSAPDPLSSRSSTFDKASIPLPTAKVAEHSAVINKSYQGVKSSYVPPLLGKNKTSSFKSDNHHSSYVPPMLGSKKPIQQENSAPAPPSEDVATSEIAAEEEGPKLSLKERIALLQKQQAEEAERQAAIVKAKQQKKEAKSQAASAASNAQIPLPSGAEISAGDVAGVTAPPLPNAEVPIDVERDEVYSDDDAEPEQELAEKEDPEPEPTPNVDNKTAAETERANTDGSDEGDEDGDEEDSEEARRAALRDRMARLAGAGGMYGGGFNPFGGVSGGMGGGASAPKKSKVKEKKGDESESNIPSAPVPIMPFATGTAPQLPKALQKEADDETQVLEDDEEVKRNFTAPNAVLDDGAEEEESTPVTEEQDELETVTSAQNRDALVDDEEFQSAEDADGEDTEPGTLVDKLANLNLTEPPKTVHSESAIEGDDEREKDTSEDDYTFSDRERERRATTAPQIPTPHLDSNIGSDYNTGYESDDDTVPKSDPANELESSTRTLDPKLDYAPATTAAPIPPVPTGISPVSKRTAPPPPVPSAQSSTAPETAPPVQSAPKVPPIITETPTKAAPPPPPIPTAAPPSEAHSSPRTAAPPIPAPSVPSSVSNIQAPSMAPPPPLPAHAAPESPVLSEVSPTIRRTSTIESARSIQSTDPMSPSVPQIPAAGPFRKASTFAAETSHAGRDSLADGLDLKSGWFLRQGELPAVYQARVGKDLIFEVDEHTVVRRGGKTLVLKDYYILHQDNSQTVIHVTFDSASPSETVTATYEKVAAPNLEASQADAYASEYGVKIFNIATSLVGASITTPLVPHILSEVHGILPAVGLRSYGATIYSNSNNMDVHKSAEFRPGDILAINRAKFQGHNKLRQKIIYDIGNSGAPFAAIITEFDAEKKKFRVIETDSHGKVKHSSYKPSDMKSGKIKVFRVVGRDFVQW